MTKRKLDESYGVPEVIQEVWSDDFAAQANATTQLKEVLLSHGRNRQINSEVIGTVVIPKMIEFLANYYQPKLQSEAASVLASIASKMPSHTQMFVDRGAIFKFIKLLSSTNQDAKNQAVLALGSIASVSYDYRKLVVAGGALPPLLVQLGEVSELTMQKNATRTLSQLCRRANISSDLTGATLRILHKLIHASDEEVLYYACRALYNLARVEKKRSQRLQYMIDIGICPQLVQLLLHPSNMVIIAALHTMGSIADNVDTRTQIIIGIRDLLPRLYQFLDQNIESSISMAACWVVSSITAGNTHHIQDVIDAKIFDRLIYHLEHADIGIKKEAAWAISNATRCATIDQIRYLTGEGCIPLLCEMLTCHDAKISKVCLKGLGNILKMGEEEVVIRYIGTNPYAEMINNCGGLSKIKDVPHWPRHPKVHDLAVTIINNFFAEDLGSSSLKYQDYFSSSF